MKRCRVMARPIHVQVTARADAGDDAATGDPCDSHTRMILKRSYRLTNVAMANPSDTAATDERQLTEFPLYRFMSDGRVYSLLTNRWLKANPTGNGYAQVVLTNTSGKHAVSVHRLIARAFHGEPSPGVVVNHKNASKSDNRADNLEWVTQAENVRDAYRAGLRVINESHRARCAALGRAKRTTTIVEEQAVIALKSGRRGDQARIARATGLSRDIIARILREYSHAC